MEERDIKFILANVFPFNNLNNKELNKFIKLSELVNYQNEDIIYKEGDSAGYFYLLLKGRVIASTKQYDADLDIELLKRGTPFGIISFFTGDAHSVTVRAIENTDILRIEKEKFKQFLNKHPDVLLDFSRILSQRVKKRSQPKTIFKSKKVGILGCRSSGKTTYMRSLGLQLKEQTFKKIICIEFSSAGRGENILNLSDWSEEKFLQYVIFDKIDYLFVEVYNSANFASLLNFLSENYHYIIYEIPQNLLKDKNFKDFMFCANTVHILLFPQKEELLLGNSIIKELINTKMIGVEKIKVILCEHVRDDKLSFEEKRKYIDHSVYATLPSMDSDEYMYVIKRLSREIGEIITGIALGGGGAFSLSHIGVLKVLQENSITIDVISGTSVGSFIAAMWAAGFDFKDMEKAAREFGRRLRPFSFVGVRFPLKGLIQAKRLEGFLRNVFGDRTFYDLEYTLRIAVFDFLSRESRILSDGLVYKAVAASCAYPGIFEPAVSKKDILLDGGILDPLPTKVLFNYGANKIIACDINPSREEIIRWHKDKSKLHVWDFIFGSIETMQREFIHQAVKISDVVIHPDLEGLGWMEFEKVQVFVERGEAAAKIKLPQLKGLAAI